MADIEDTSIRALAKLEQVLPKRLRSRVNALQMYTVPMFTVTPTVSPEHLASVAQACRDQQRLRFTYRKRDGETSSRLVEPYRLVHVNRKWYVLSWDMGRQDWRTFRVDRMESLLLTGVRFQQRELPAEDAAAYVAQSITSSLAGYRALVTLPRRSRWWRSGSARATESSRRSITGHAGCVRPPTRWSGWRSPSGCSASSSRCTSRLN
ncbi:hypothetical protein SVIOM74S_05514 [Streptomyces violarus]